MNSTLEIASYGGGLGPLASALALAARGWPCFPMTRAKRPACPHGVLDATADPEALRRLFAARGAALAAIATGAPSGVSVLDIDRQHGGGAWWSANRERLPPTLAWRTRSGGLHLAFVHRPGLRSSVARIAPGVDIRAEGGGAIFWPATGLPILADLPPARWPEWLVPPPPPPPVPAWRELAWSGTDARRRRYALAALGNGCERVARAGEGARNATLNAEAFGLMRLAREGAIDAAEIAEGLAIAARAAGLEARETAATLASALLARGLA